VFTLDRRTVPFKAHSVLQHQPWKHLVVVLDKAAYSSRIDPIVDNVRLYGEHWTYARGELRCGHLQCPDIPSEVVIQITSVLTAPLDLVFSSDHGDCVCQHASG